jgi:hypothetical protein
MEFTEKKYSEQDYILLNKTQGYISGTTNNNFMLNKVHITPDKCIANFSKLKSSYQLLFILTNWILYLYVECFHEKEIFSKKTKFKLTNLYHSRLLTSKSMYYINEDPRLTQNSLPK